MEALLAVKIAETFQKQRRKSGYHLNVRQFNLSDKEVREVNFGTDMIILINTEENVMVHSQNGIYSRVAYNPENIYHHEGKVKFENYGSNVATVDFVQLTWID